MMKASSILSNASMLMLLLMSAARVDVSHSFQTPTGGTFVASRQLVGCGANVKCGRRQALQLYGRRMITLDEPQKIEPLAVQPIEQDVATTSHCHQAPLPRAAMATALATLTAST